MNLIAESELAPHLLLVESDDAVRRGLQLLLTGQGYRVHAFSRAALALADTAAITASHVVIDYVQTESDGIEALRLLQAHGWKGRAILITTFDTQRLRDTALRAGFAATLLKPFPDTHLLEALRGEIMAD